MNYKSTPLEQRFLNGTFLVLLALLICRLIANYCFPLFDTTEARYAEIARKMLETGDWITLQQDYGIPFWAKPPLSTWLSAFSMKLLGVNEFAARLPGLLLSIGVLALVWDLVNKVKGTRIALISILVLAGTFFFFLDAGAVMTDPALLFCITLSCVSFWHAYAFGSKAWSYCFFVGLGLGMLAKGPLAVVLVGLTVFFWVLFRKEWKNLWQCLPWFSGTLLAALIALPWYICAEIKTPGFLNYFIVGEHFQRFLTPGWAGDKYGFAHHAPKGMIWLYAVVGVFPWNILGIKGLIQQRKHLMTKKQDDGGWVTYLFVWMLVPLLFFTFSSNIIYPYVFPALPAFAILFSELWCRFDADNQRFHWLYAGALISGVAFLIGSLVIQFIPNLTSSTQKPVVTEWLKTKPQQESKLIYWGYQKPFSAEFYSAGKVMLVKDVVGLCKIISDRRGNYLVVNSKLIEVLPQELVNQLKHSKVVDFSNGNYFLIENPRLASC
ncbi:ArnT family glycosyltransferase [Legionella waltersii]|uniref:Melitin resistance protein n=1 Tax=Legionella waltersii TaxID=66969 RepID=A0A0W1A039_9GAMM|nr:glycosyltransferase family 39 protein [Legionella waltersii]KTD74721.1 melitin resistance protein [Legionella waltersii]SNV00063.1 melitin resistance protein [Legionella waltersii]